ncbi:hypothetical protein AB6Q56_14860 [Dechloromonas sp. ARDL1]|uniref:hypothetical protein n=1 Tax=Dechloromonas sp. ARDL1 TaxID=3322121 RepID=UPI003DA77A30
MEKRNDIAAFPELFDGMEQFIEEQASGLKRTSAMLALAVAVPGSLFVLATLNRLF